MQPEKMALVSAKASPDELILRDFAATIGRKRYEHWFEKKTQVRVEGDVVVVAVATPFLVNWMSQNFRTGLLASARSVIGADVNIRFEVRTELKTDLKSVSAEDLVPSAHGLSVVGDRHVRVDGKRTSDRNVTSVGGVSRAAVPEAHVTRRSDVPAPDQTAVSNRMTDKVADASREALRKLCANSKSGSGTPSSIKINVAAAAATISARSANDSGLKPVIESAERHATSAGSAATKAKPSISSPSTSSKAAAGRNASGASTSGRHAEGTAKSSERERAPAQVEATKPVVEKSIIERAEERKIERTAEKLVPSVSRVTKDSPLTMAKVKPVEEPPRPGRRFADLMDLVEGPCNEFALSAARQVCQAPGVQFTTLFVHGPVGVGKTHLLEGIHRDLKQRFPSRQVVYLTAEAFANFFTQALRDHKLPTFRNKFRSIDVLIVDDIDFLDGKRGIQEEFLFTVQQLESHGRMVVVGAHGHPRLLTKMSEELRTRFLAGMVCRIDAPDVMTRRRILENKAFRAGAEFALEVFQFVADRFRNNVRELEGAFNTLLAYQRMQGRRLSQTAARNALADMERDCIRVVRIVDIEQAVCSMFGVTTEDLKSNKRQKSLSQPRMLAMYLARKHTRAAYTEIGQHFGGRNHSTVMAAEKKIQASMGGQEPIVIRTQSWRVCDLVETLEQQLQAG
jgi:chromosomal replication initiator protein